MKDVLTLTAKLIIITVIAGLLLGLVYSIAEQPIAEQQLKESTMARKQVLKDADKFEKYKGKISSKEYSEIQEIYIGKDADGKQVGAAVNMLVKGYSPGLNLTVGIKADGSVNAIVVGANSETPGLGAKATEPEFTKQFSGLASPISVKKTAPAGDSEIVAITGATITSRGVTNAVNLACKYYEEYIGGDK